MQNFNRAIRLCLRHRWTLAASILCALAVGVLWTANIGAVYPFVQSAFEGKSIPELIDEKTAEAQAAAAEQRRLVERLAAERTEAETTSARAEFDRQIEAARYRCEVEEAVATRYGWIAPTVGRWAPRGPVATLALLCGLLFVGTVLKGLFIIAHCLLVARIAHLATLNLRTRLFRRALGWDVATFGREGVADLMSRLTGDVDSLAIGLNTLLGKLVREPLKMIICLIAAAFICWKLLVLTLLFLPVAGLAIHWLAKMLKRANRRAMEEMASIFATLEEAFFSITIIQAFRMEARQRAKFHANARTFYRKAMQVAKYNGMAHPLTEILGIVMICLALGAGAYLVLSQSTTLAGIPMCARPLHWPDLILFYGMLIGAADPARKLAGLFNEVQRAAAASDRIYEMLDRRPRVRNVRAPKALPRHARELVFDHVSFAYEAGQPILHAIDLRIRFGETIALVGPSGCGKSTLTKLIPRFADPEQGEVRVDGVSLREARLGDLRRQIGLVTQEPILFNDTVDGNIRFGSPRATREQVIAAAKAAHAHEFITKKLPDGYDTTVGPKGGQLSGGQRQRIALARALLRDPAILILDEATGNIDMRSEQLINQSLGAFAGSRTTILITHRPSSLELADRIVVIEEGRIIAVGMHDELFKSCPFYRDLFQMKQTA